MVRSIWALQVVAFFPHQTVFFGASFPKKWIFQASALQTQENNNRDKDSPNQKIKKRMMENKTTFPSLGVPKAKNKEEN